MTGTDPELPAHLNPEAMAAANRELVCKALAEFSHERLITPVADGASYLVTSDDGSVCYRFHARRHALEHWAIDAATLTRDIAGEPAPPDAQELIIELNGVLGIPQQLLGTYLEEIAATLAGAAWKYHHQRRSADELVDADFQTIEQAMTEGHPCFVANSGRIGFGLADHAAYAPETGAPVRLVWLAVLREHSTFAGGAGVDEQEHYESELGTETLRRFSSRLAELGLDPEAYRYLPVHPWQWEHKHSITFAPEVARRAIVVLGTGSDRYQAQQSIRTFFNTDRPERHYVKTALSIQNMGFMRGLSPAYMRATPAVSDWVAELIAGDDTLRACGFHALRELASVGYTGDAYHRAGPRSPYQRMVAALWRESPVGRIADGERLATMASLLHRDRDGRSVVTAMIAASGCSARQWLSSYLRAYLRPIVHCLLRYDLAFMPHGENIILVLDDYVPRRVFIKDIGEETAVMNDRDLPERVAGIRLAADDDVKALSIHTDVFDGFLRHLAAVLDADGVLTEAVFWELVAACITEHGADHPELDGRLRLLRDRFKHSCLNRLQLRDTLRMVDLDDQPGSLMFAGTLKNPAAEAGS